MSLHVYEVACTLGFVDIDEPRAESIRVLAGDRAEDALDHVKQMFGGQEMEMAGEPVICNEVVVHEVRRLCDVTAIDIRALHAVGVIELVENETANGDAAEQ